MAAINDRTGENRLNTQEVHMTIIGYRKFFKTFCDFVAHKEVTTKKEVF